MLELVFIKIFRNLKYLKYINKYIRWCIVIKAGEANELIY